MVERRTMEKKKKIQMKRLCLHLSSLISNLEERVETLKQKRDFGILFLEARQETETRITGTNSEIGIRGNEELPVVEIWQNGRELEIMLISNVTRALRFYEVLGLLESKGVEMTDGTHSVVGGTIIHAIRAEVNPAVDYHYLLMNKLKALAQ